MADIVVSGRRSGKSARIRQEWDRFALGLDPAACGCVQGVLVGQRSDGVMGVLEEVDARCARHDVIEGEVVRPALESGPVG